MSNKRARQLERRRAKVERERRREALRSRCSVCARPTADPYVEVTDSGKLVFRVCDECMQRPSVRLAVKDYMERLYRWAAAQEVAALGAAQGVAAAEEEADDSERPDWNWNV